MRGHLVVFDPSAIVGTAILCSAALQTADQNPDQVFLIIVGSSPSGGGRVGFPSDVSRLI